MAYFQPFLSLFFAEVEGLIDWSCPHTFLNAELQRLTGQAGLGRRYADCLVKVYLKDGHPAWLLIHIEIQAKADADFNCRMFEYYYRIYDHYPQQELISLALLTDQPDATKVGEYSQERDGYGVSFRFRVHNLRQHDVAELQAKSAYNPLALIALAQQVAHRQADDHARQLQKREIIWLLYRHRYSRQDILKCVRFIDWLIRLPPPLEQSLRDELIRYEQETKMTYVMSYERMAEQRGMKAGIEQGLEQGLEQGKLRGEIKTLIRQCQRKFGVLEPEIVARIKAADMERVEIWLDRILDASTPAELFAEEQ